MRSQGSGNKSGPEGGSAQRCFVPQEPQDVCPETRGSHALEGSALWLVPAGNRSGKEPELPGLSQPPAPRVHGASLHQHLSCPGGPASVPAAGGQGVGRCRPELPQVLPMGAQASESWEERGGERWAQNPESSVLTLGTAVPRARAASAGSEPAWSRGAGRGPRPPASLPPRWQGPRSLGWLVVTCWGHLADLEEDAGPPGPGSTSLPSPPRAPPP